MPELLGAAWNLQSDLSNFIVATHRLTDLGGVFTHMAHETSQEGFYAEWRVVSVLTLKGDMVNRAEVFDEADLNAALARFDELSRPAPALENAASRLDDRFKTYFAARDWDAMAAILADDFSIDDRRRVVNIGIRNGRDVEIANMRAAAEIGTNAFTFVVIATRGEHLALSRIRAFGRDQGPEAFHTDALGVVEINADNRITARVAFDLDDIDAAFEELDARYLAGEAAPHRDSWSVVTQARAALARHELPATTPDWVNLDHRRGIAFTSGDMTAYIRASWDLEQQFSTYIETVHRLNDLGAVFTQVAKGTSQEGFDAEWRVLEIITAEGVLINRAEFFDEADLDAASARFDELSQPAPQLENAASRVNDRLLAHFSAGNWDDMSEILADEYVSDDRRHVPNVGVRQGRDVAIANMRTSADLGVTFSKSHAIATRGARLVLSRVRWSGRDQRPEEFHTEVVNVVEINADQRVTARVWFDADDLDAALAELDARYRAGEAAPYSRLPGRQSREAYAAGNRHEFPSDTGLREHRPPTRRGVRAR